MGDPMITEEMNPEIPDEDENDLGGDMDAFEREYQADHSWEQLTEDEQGRLLPVDPAEEQRAKRRRLLEQHGTLRVRRGMIRYMQVLIDVSTTASAQDFKPNRYTVIVNLLKDFIREFFDQNPLSQLGILLMKNGQAQKLSDLSSSPDYHIKRLEKNLDLEGCISLQNGLELALDTLKTVPAHGHREVVCVVAALNTCDPGNIHESIKNLKREHVRVSVIGIAAEVYICKHVAQETGGQYHVALSEKHLEDSLLGLIPPPPALAETVKAALVRMGFPEKNPNGLKGYAFAGSDSQLMDGGYTCNRCKARVTDLPCECHVCGLALVSSPHIARAYHHLFPVKPFREVGENLSPRAKSKSSVKTWDEGIGDSNCFGCLMELRKEIGVILQCDDCENLFCFECDSYIHGNLHNCPGCECQKGKQQVATGPVDT